MVELYLAKVDVAGSNPVSRSIFFTPDITIRSIPREARLAGNVLALFHLSSLDKVTNFPLLLS